MLEVELDCGIVQTTQNCHAKYVQTIFIRWKLGNSDKFLIEKWIYQIPHLKIEHLNYRQSFHSATDNRLRKCLYFCRLSVFLDINSFGKIFQKRIY